MGFVTPLLPFNFAAAKNTAHDRQKEIKNEEKTYDSRSILRNGHNAHELTAANPNPSVAYTTERTIDGKEKIDLQGTWSMTSNVVRASISNNMVCITFGQSVGYVNVLLYDDNGSLVYNCSVDTAVQKTALLPIAGGHDGVYTIVVENTNDTAAGQFERR